MPENILWVDSSLADSEMAGLYAAADAFVLPTRAEGWGRPFMEAMAMGIPVVGTGWGGHMDFIRKLEEVSELREVSMKAWNESNPWPFQKN